MRYLSIPDINFTDVNGRSAPAKDIRPLQDNLETLIEVKLESGAMLDEIASREEHYGDSQEDLTFAIVDHNAVKIVEAGWDLSKLKTIKLPDVEEGF